MASVPLDHELVDVDVEDDPEAEAAIDAQAHEDRRLVRDVRERMSAAVFADYVSMRRRLRRKRAADLAARPPDRRRWRARARRSSRVRRR